MPEPSASAASRAPNPVLAVLGRVLESALNRLVDLDPDTRASLSELDGRAITLDVANTPLAMRIAVSGDRLTIGPAFDAASALRIAASPGALLGFALARGREQPYVAGRVEVAGDADLARRIERIATRFAPDFDEAFARVFGDVAGVQIARGVRGALSGMHNGAQALARDTATFLSEESRDLLAKAELDEFLDSVDALRERTDRLDARVRRLASAQRKPAA